MVIEIVTRLQIDYAVTVPDRQPGPPHRTAPAPAPSAPDSAQAP